MTKTGQFEYINANPLYERELLRIYDLERVIDRWDHLTFHARGAGLTVQKFFQKNPQLRSVETEYKQATKDPAFRDARNSGGMAALKRWRFISGNEKLNARPELEKAIELLDYPVRQIGDACAHHRPAAVRPFMYTQRDGSHGVRKTPKSDAFVFHDDWVRFEACYLLNLICDGAIEKFYLGPWYERRRQRLDDRIRALPKTYASSARGARRNRVYI